MATAGPLFPGTVATAQETGDDNDWTSAANVAAEDGAEATVTAASYDANDQTFALRCSNFGFDAVIGAGATIDGITVEVHRRCFAGSARDGQVQLFSTAGTAIGDDKATLDAWPGTLGTATYGGTTDDWGLGVALTAALIRSAEFGVQVKAFATGANTDVGIDFIRMTVTYTAAVGGAAPISAYYTHYYQRVVV